MKILVLGASDRDVGRRQYVSSYLINGRVAIDAGCLGLRGSPEEQEAVRHVFLTHSHMDHVASLPSFLENVWTPGPECPVVYGSSATLDAVHRHIFNDEIWPDFVALSERIPPFLKMERLEAEVPVEVEGLTLTPVLVNHAVPTFGYVVREGANAVIFAGDSGPTRRLWEAARATPGLKGVFLEASFPNRMRRIAEASLHLTPEMFAQEAAELPRGVRLLAVHLKVRYREEIESELRALELPGLEIAECERDYEF